MAYPAAGLSLSDIKYFGPREQPVVNVPLYLELAYLVRPRVDR